MEGFSKQIENSHKIVLKGSKMTREIGDTLNISQNRESLEFFM